MRSAVYRSFVTCDDSKGVIECGTIRKSKFCPKEEEEEEVIPRGKKKKNQLNEVAREALKLNRMANSYSKRSSFDGNSKEIAKDLLKGALDLQESLIMLGKLQESSTKNQILGFKKQRLSVSSGYNYSRDCFDELREAIKEGLAKQNLLLRRRNPDMASTSSSSSSLSSSKMENSQPRNPNLIAKLMGLDHIPPRTDSYKQSHQPPPIVLIKPTRFLKLDFDTKEMIKADQKPVKRLNQELELKDMVRRRRFKHQEDSAGVVPKKKKEETIQRRKENSKSNSKTKKETIVPTIPPRRNVIKPKPKPNPKPKPKPNQSDKKLTTPKEEKLIVNKIDTKHVLLTTPPLFIPDADEIAVDSGSENDRRLIIDYAKEFMQESFDKSSVTLEQLVDEVCKGIGENAGGDGGDGGLDEVIIRSWDLGRREMDLIVGDIEKMIIREMMDTLIIDFQYN